MKTEEKYRIRIYKTSTGYSYYDSSAVSIGVNIRGTNLLNAVLHTGSGILYWI